MAVDRKDAHMRGDLLLGVLAADALVLRDHERLARAREHGLDPLRVHGVLLASHDQLVRQPVYLLLHERAVRTSSMITTLNLLYCTIIVREN